MTFIGDESHRKELGSWFPSLGPYLRTVLLGNTETVRPVTWLHLYCCTIDIIYPVHTTVFGPVLGKHRGGGVRGTVGYEDVPV